MIEFLERLDIDLFVTLNGFHGSFLDGIMLALSNRYYPVPFYALLVGLIVWKYGKNGIWVVLALGLSVLVANHITSEIMKPFFQRLRPCYNPDLVDQIRLLVPCAGKWSFASSHASTTFGLATGVWLFFRSKVNWAWIGFVWSGLVSYSRIYVGKHYPADVVVGAAVGILTAWLIYQGFLWLDRRYSLSI